MINYKYVRIFNLIDEKFPFRTIQNLYSALVKFGEKPEKIFNNIGKNHAAKRAMDRYINTQYDYLSTFSLLATGISINSVKKINEEFKTIEQIEKNMNHFFSIGYNRPIINKTIDFIYKYRIYKSLLNKDLALILLHILEKEKILTNDKLYENLLSIRYFSIEEFDSAVIELLETNLIVMTGNGYRMRLFELEEYLNLYPNNNKKIVHRYLRGDKINDILKDFDFTRQRLYQIIDKEIKDYPLFENEEKYASVLIDYDIDLDYLNLLGFTDSLLIKYVFLKHKFKERKNVIEYIVDYNLEETFEAQKIFIKENKLFYNGQIYEITFDNLVKKYVEEKKMRYFNAKEIYHDYNQFLKNLNLEKEIKPNIDVFCRSLDRTKNFLNYTNRNYYYFIKENLNVEFYKKTEEYLDNFYGYAYINHLYNEYEELFLENQIYEPKQLFAVMKQIYGDKFKNKIKFVRNPTVASNGLTKDKFFLEKLEELQPIKIDDFAEILEKEYGHPKDNFNYSNSKFINKHLNKDGYLTTKELTVSDEESRIFNKIVEDNIVLSTEYYEIELAKYGEEVKSKLRNSQTLRVLGYRIVSNAIYMNKFSNYEEAMISLFKELPLRLTRQLLSSYINDEQFDQIRYQVIFNQNMIIEYENNVYMNIIKRDIQKDVLNFKVELIEALNPIKFYTVKNLIEESFYINLLEKYEEVRAMINSYGLKILENIIISSLELTSLKTKTLIFSKDIRASKNEIVRYHIKQEKSIYRDELEYLLNDEYLMDITLTRSYINELGFYYDLNKDRIYDSKERSDKETIQYFIGGENKNEN